MLDWLQKYWLEAVYIFAVYLHLICLWFISGNSGQVNKPLKWISDWWSISQNATSAKCVCVHVCVHALGWCWAVAGAGWGAHPVLYRGPHYSFSSWSHHQAACLLSVTWSLPAFEFDALLLVQVFSVVLECWTPFILRQTKGADKDFSRKFRNINCYFSVKIFLSF